MKTIPPFARLPKTYETHCRMLLPRPLRDDVNHDNMMEVIDVMAGHDLNEDQADYLELLSTLVSEYDKQHYAIDLAHIKPHHRLRSLCEERGINASALGDLVGNRSLGSKLLRGERELSKAHIRALSSHFKISPAFFF